MMADELKPCPFCNASGENLGLLCDPAEGLDNSGPSRRVQCYGCNIEAPFYDSRVEAIAAWNTRPAPKADSALVGEPDRNQPHPLSQIWAGAFHAWVNGSHWDACESLRAALSDRDVVLEEAIRTAENCLIALPCGVGLACGAQHARRRIIEDLTALKGGVDE